MKKVYIVGTCDNKYEELNFVKNRILQAGISAVLVDVGTLTKENQADISAVTLANYHPTRKDFLKNNEGRGDAVIAVYSKIST